jgi:hypothetical protein
MVRRFFAGSTAFWYNPSGYHPPIESHITADAIATRLT